MQSEAETYGVELLPVFMDSADAPLPTFAAGMHAIRTLATNLGGRYRGALITGAVNEIPDLRSWILDLMHLHRPVVWFDRYDTDIGPPIESRNFVRCHFSEEAGVQKALEYLVDHGHLRIVYPSENLETEQWQAYRARLLERLASRCSPSPTIFVVPDTEDLIAYITRHAITAVISPSDRYARHWYGLCTRHGMRIPDDLSLVSFDNRYTLHPWPINSVDFGFGHLGYCAFHTILGLLPIKTDRRGAIAGQPFVSIKGSVGPAR
jgi:DNA-binding LacI/PurR family transcriptional regulator